MSQYLGGVPSGAVVASVHNYGTVDIPRGRVVSLYPDADMVFGAETAIVGQGYGAGNAFKIPIRNWVVTTQDYPCGISVQQIPAGEDGTIVIYGLCIVETDGGVSAGEQLQIATNGVADTFAAGQKFGLALNDDGTWGGVQDGPTASTATYSVAFVSFSALLFD